MLDKSTLSVVGGEGLLTQESQASSDKRGSGGAGSGSDNAGGDIAVYPMLLDQLPGGTCSCCKSFKSSFFHIDFALVQIFAFLEDGYCHIYASPILHVLVPIRTVSM